MESEKDSHIAFMIGTAIPKFAREALFHCDDIKLRQEARNRSRLTVVDTAKDQGIVFKPVLHAV